MTPPPALRRALRFALTAAVLLSAAGLGAAVGCGPAISTFWVCLNPVTGLETDAPFDSTHYVNGVFDPCHCYDLCGPEKTCPVAVDAGLLPASCDADGGDDAGDAGGW